MLLRSRLFGEGPVFDAEVDAGGDPTVKRNFGAGANGAPPLCRSPLVVALPETGSIGGMAAMVASISAEQRRQLQDVWAYRVVVRAFRLMALSFSTLALMLAAATLGRRGKGLGFFFGAAFIFMLAGFILMMFSSTALTMHMRKVLVSDETTSFGRSGLLIGMVLRDAFSIRRETT